MACRRRRPLFSASERSSFREPNSCFRPAMSSVTHCGQYTNCSFSSWSPCQYTCHKTVKYQRPFFKIIMITNKQDKVHKLLYSCFPSLLPSYGILLNKVDNFHYSRSCLGLPPIWENQSDREGWDGRSTEVIF